MDAKLRDVADWRLWHNNTDTPLLEVDARDMRQKWALPAHVPPMHPHWHRPADMRPEVPSCCCRNICCYKNWGIATHPGLYTPVPPAARALSMQLAMHQCNVHIITCYRMGMFLLRVFPRVA